VCSETLFVGTTNYFMAHAQFCFCCMSYMKVKDPLLPGPVNIGSSEMSFRFQPGAADTQRPASKTNAFTMGYMETAVLFDEYAII
jgi:hypothetical protein